MHEKQWKNGTYKKKIYHRLFCVRDQALDMRTDIYNVID